MCNYVLCALLNIPETSFPLKYKSRAMTGLHKEYKLCVNFRSMYLFSRDISFISFQPWRPGLAGTRAQSCDQYGSGTLHPGQVLGGSLPLLSPAFRRSCFSRQVSQSATTREILAPKGGTVGEKDSKVLHGAHIVFICYVWISKQTVILPCTTYR